MPDKNPSPAVAHLGPLFEAPLLVADEKLQTFVSLVQSMVEHKDFERAVFSSDAAVEDDQFWDSTSYMVRYYRPYRIEDGVLTIPVRGSLSDRMAYQFGAWSTGYEYIRRAVARGMSDPRVDAIAFNIDSPGGGVAGNFELAGYIAEQRGRKPMRAYANHLALSGGFSIASAADEIVVSPSGFTGSVGVVAAHFDVSQMLEDFGVKVSLIYAGKYKTEGNSYEPLGDEARERMQASVDKTYDKFVSLVAGNRNISYDDVRSTEALVFDAEDSVNARFADRVAEQRVDVRTFTRGPAPNGGAEVTDKANAGGDQAAPQEQVDTAKIESDARAEERKRFADVHASDDYKGREKLAEHLLSTTDMSAESIIATLAVSPKQEATPPADTKGEQRNHFNEAMNAAGAPDAGATDPDDDKQVTPEAFADGVFASVGYAPRAAAH